jgi:hypothetical protein
MPVTGARREHPVPGLESDGIRVVDGLDLGTNVSAVSFKTH